MKLAGVELPPAVVSAIRTCKHHLWAAAGFSFLINLLFLAPALYMLQVYDRVVATGGKLTLLFLTLALAFALLTLTGLDAIRARLLVRAGATITKRSRARPVALAKARYAEPFVALGRVHRKSPGNGSNWDEL